jgi:hypothetical protein
MMPLSSTDRNMQVLEALKSIFRGRMLFFPNERVLSCPVLIRGIEKVLEKKKKAHMGKSN